LLGAIIGDVAGSMYEVMEIIYQKENKCHRPYEERIKILNKNVPLFTDESSVTDDSILTCAIYDAIKNGNCNYEKYLKEYSKKELSLGMDMYGRSRFGSNYVSWVLGNYQGASYGNGAAMRISAVGFLFDNMEEVKKNSYYATIPSHNNYEAIMSAEAVATSIYLLRNGYSKEEVIEYVKTNYYNLDYNLIDLQQNYKFSSRSSESVPEAIYVFSESVDFEDAIRKAISIGGDSDTIACIVGALSEACYGVPKELKEKVKPYLRDYMINLLNDKYYKEFEDGRNRKKIKSNE